MTDERRELTRGDVDKAIDELSYLDAVDYELVREAKAEEYDMRVVTLDKLVKRKQNDRRVISDDGADDDWEHEHEVTRPPAFTDEALALKFAAEHRGDFKYVALWGKWLWFDSCRWAFDDTLKIFDKVRETCRKAAADCNDDRLGKTWQAPRRSPPSSDCQSPIDGLQRL